MSLVSQLQVIEQATGYNAHIRTTSNSTCIVATRGPDFPRIVIFSSPNGKGIDSIRIVGPANSSIENKFNDLAIHDIINNLLRANQIYSNYKPIEVISIFATAIDTATEHFEEIKQNSKNAAERLAEVAGYEANPSFYTHQSHAATSQQKIDL